MTTGSVKKEMKQKSFAAAVKREDIEHVIATLQTVAGPLGFA